ncbi:MAG: hypothetical protein UR23_C0016G0002 [Candidatus Roizmanbacteria bacterium GW2011_GWA2_32_13]|uniref:RloB domain-containing protein n=1 Tax=Candidatus Roizmanbacteria bacterium GW2011_GWA2_32_13 TaxID=1618475 RepID=A0A0G0BZW2_9BACT|nr:MAG: hypothetical protein UR23_C0016G0002 [Candidatus Roizmanbacteria bacterium GW2011_GWA2_32_13]
MSRTNPYKLKRRQANKTLLIFGEGFSEEIFLKYLRRAYSFNKNVAITIKRGKGGTPYNVVLDANKIPGAFDRRIVIIDNDKSKTEMEKARNLAKEKNIELIENTPCLESLFINILDKKYNQNSVWFKHEFESKYLDRKKRDELDEYMKLFPKKILDKKQTEIPELKKLISIMEGN